MLQLLTRGIVSRCLVQNFTQKAIKNAPRCIFPAFQRQFHTINAAQIEQPNVKCPSLLQHPSFVKLLEPPKRDLTKFSLTKGKRKTVKAVLKRFYRLNWGAWIRTKSGRHKKIWKKRASRRRRLRQHVITNATQSWLLDKMVTKYWKKPKYYVDDPYEPYHEREEFHATRKKPV